MLVELIFALIFTLELVPGDGGTYAVDVLENTELTMEVRAEQEGEVARFFGEDGAEMLVTERSQTAGHLYTAFPEEGEPVVLDIGPALEDLRPFAVEPTQTIPVTPDSETGAVDVTLVRRGELFYLGIPSIETLLIVRSEDSGGE